MTVTKKELAAKLDVTVRTVDRWLKAGMPVQKTGETPRFDMDLVRAWATDNGLGTVLRVDHPSVDPGANGTPDDTATYAAARATREKYEALSARAEYLKATGSLVDAESVRKIAFATSRRALEALMAIPHRLDPLLAAETDSDRRMAIWSTELRLICAEIARVGDAPLADG